MDFAWPVPIKIFTFLDKETIDEDILLIGDELRMSNGKETYARITESSNSKSGVPIIHETILTAYYQGVTILEPQRKGPPAIIDPQEELDAFETKITFKPTSEALALKDKHC